jgi:hypothetical protein
MLQKLTGVWAKADLVEFPTLTGFVRTSTEDGEAAPITVVIEPIREVVDIASPASESEAEAIIQYGSDQACSHEVVLDCSRGLVFTVSAVHLQVDLRNIGGGQQEAIPTRKWHVSASIHATARVTPTLRALRFGALARETWSPYDFVPNFAFAFTFPRVGQVPVLVSFEGGAGQVIADFMVPRDEDPRFLVPNGADRVRVRALDDGLIRGRLQFELAL